MHFLRVASTNEGEKTLHVFKNVFGENRGFKSTMQSQIPFGPWKKCYFFRVIPFLFHENSINGE